MNGGRDWSKVSELDLLDEAMSALVNLHLSGAGVRLEMSLQEAVALVSLVQLAFRHPHIEGGGLPGRLTAESTRGVIQRLEEKFASYPAIAEMLRRGWLKEYDQR